MPLAVPRPLLPSKFVEASIIEYQRGHTAATGPESRIGDDRRVVKSHLSARLFDEAWSAGRYGDPLLDSPSSCPGTRSPVTSKDSSRIAHIDAGHHTATVKAATTIPSSERDPSDDDSDFVVDLTQSTPPISRTRSIMTHYDDVIVLS